MDTNMKKILNIVICTAAVLAMTSCEKFFTREPINKFSAETYFASEAEMKMYTDGMLNSWLPDYSETASADAYNDLIGTKTSSDFFRADVEWDSSKQGTTWSWTFARRCNYMIEMMEKNGKGKVADDVYNHYLGLARFWRAYTYFSRVKTWSNVPWIPKYLQPTDSLLYADRDDREFVMHNVIEDLKFACEHVKPMAVSAATKNQVNNDVVNGIASRIFLYEGTYRLNHAVNHATGKPWTNKYEKPQEILQLAADAAKKVIDSGNYKLTSDYPGIFTSTSLVDDVIWGQIFILESNGRHAYTRYFNSSTLGQQYSGTKDLVMHFLKADGTPVENGYQDINEEFKGRDPRLGYTILGPDRRVKNLSGDMVPAALNFTFCKTGYMLVKWCIPDESHYQNSVDENCISIMRYSEILLNYAEAMNELGKFDGDIWAMTVGAIRSRVNLPNGYPGIGSKPDSWLENYYTKDVHNTHITEGDLAIALEIRRERVTELTFESELRQNDLYRWAQCDLIERRYNHQGWAGLWVSADEAKNGFTFAGKTYTFGNEKSSNSETNYPISNTENSNWSLEKAGDGFYLVYNYKLKWDDNKMYVRPLCTNDKVLNPNLTESYGW